MQSWKESPVLVRGHFVAVARQYGSVTELVASARNKGTDAREFFNRLARQMGLGAMKSFWREMRGNYGAA